MAGPRSSGNLRRVTFINNVEEESLIKAYRLINLRQNGSNASLSPGEVPLDALVKLNALKQSVGDQIGEKAFAQWLRNKTESATAALRDQNAEIIADTLGKLVQDGGLKLPRGGYLVTRGRGRVVVTRAKS